MVTFKDLKDMSWEELEIRPSMPLNFRTHLNYVSCMKELSENLEIKLNFKIDSKSKHDKKYLKKKLRLANLIKESLDEEYKKTKKEKDFAKVCSIWISVKAYYLVFNLLLILHSLINDEKENLNYSHSKTISTFRNLLKTNKLEFNKIEFNMVLSCGNAFSFNSNPGDTLRQGVNNNLITKSILKKLCKYKLNNFCRYKEIKDFRKKENRIKRDSFFKNSDISLFEFFYWYRIKTNYQDLSFLDQEIYENDVVKFYESYYFLTLNFYNALKVLINEISKKRFGEKII